MMTDMPVQGGLSADEGLVMKNGGTSNSEPTIEIIEISETEAKSTIREDHESQAPTFKDNRLDRLEQLMIKQSQETKAMQEVIMANLGLEYPDDYEYQDGHSSLVQEGQRSLMQDSQRRYENNSLNNGGQIEDQDARVIIQHGRPSTGLREKPAEGMETTNENLSESHVTTRTPGSGNNETGFAARFCCNNTKGKAVDHEIATGIRRMMTDKIQEKMINEVMDTYDTPENIPELCVPLVNDTIWNSLSPRVRSTDCKIQRAQKYLIKGLTAYVADKSKTQTNEADEDAWACLTAANNELNMIRRDLIKPELNQRFTHLCRTTAKVTDQLFGDDLSKQIKDLAESQKATWQVVKPRFPLQSKRMQPYPHRVIRATNPFRQTGVRQPFLGHRPQMHPYRGRGMKQRGGQRSYRPLYPQQADSKILPQ